MLLPDAEDVVAQLIQSQTLTEAEREALRLVFDVYYQVVEHGDKVMYLPPRQLKTCLECGKRFYVGSVLYRRKDARTCSAACDTKRKSRQHQQAVLARRALLNGPV